jgi:hypothetical protein
MDPITDIAVHVQDEVLLTQPEVLQAWFRCASSPARLPRLGAQLLGICPASRPLVQFSSVHLGLARSRQDLVGLAATTAAAVEPPGWAPFNM